MHEFRFLKEQKTTTYKIKREKKFGSKHDALGAGNE